jgi:hypothetical protein
MILCFSINVHLFFCMLRLPRYCGKVWGVRMRPHSCILTYWYSRSPRRALQFVQCFKQPASQASIVKNGFPENRRASHCLLRLLRRTASMVPETNLCQPGTGTLPRLGRCLQRIPRGRFWSNCSPPLNRRACCRRSIGRLVHAGRDFNRVPILVFTTSTENSSGSKPDHPSTWERDGSAKAVSKL